MHLACARSLRHLRQVLMFLATMTVTGEEFFEAIFFCKITFKCVRTIASFGARLLL